VETRRSQGRAEGLRQLQLGHSRRRSGDSTSTSPPRDGCVSLQLGHSRRRSGDRVRRWSRGKDSEASIGPLPQAEWRHVRRVEQAHAQAAASIGPLPQAEWRPGHPGPSRRRSSCFNWATPAGGVETARSGFPLGQELPRFNWATPAGGVETVLTTSPISLLLVLQLGHSRRRSGDANRFLVSGGNGNWLQLGHSRRRSGDAPPGSCPR